MKHLFSISGLLAIISAGALAQGAAPQEYYRRFWFDPQERLQFCSPVDSLSKEFEAFGVERDTAGRPVLLTRYFYGNPDTRWEWSMMRIEYRGGAGGNLLVRRTFHAPNGMPLVIGRVAAEEVLYKNGTTLALRRSLDTAGHLVNDTGSVSQSYFRDLPGGTRQQEFFYGAGKQHFGADLPWRTFAPLPKGAYFRLFTTDSEGRLIREELRSFEKKPVPFPGGEYVRRYEPGACGLPESVEYLTLEGEPAANAAGIASERFAYDDRGRIVSWEAFDLSGKPKGRPSDGAARLERSYRQFDGMLLAERKYDERGEQIGAQ